METALPEQMKTFPDPFEEEKRQKDETSYQLPKIQTLARVPKHKILEEYVKDNSIIEISLLYLDSRFDPLREITKEKNLTEFFLQKELLLNVYLAEDDKEVKPIQPAITSTQFSRSKIKSRTQIYKNLKMASQRQQSQKLIKNIEQNMDGGNKKFLRQKKTRAEEMIDSIQDQINSQLDVVDDRKKQAEQEERNFKQEIERITQHNNQRVQRYVDPRTSKLRSNFHQINEKLDEIRRLDPQMTTLSKIKNKLKVFILQVKQILLLTDGQKGQSQNGVQQRESREQVYRSGRKPNQQEFSEQILHNDISYQERIRKEIQVKTYKARSMIKSRSNAAILNEILSIGRDEFTSPSPKNEFL